jgi:hypothetical protein
MGISLIHAGLAAGAALSALPVILHLFMKQTPKHVVFPALRLIRERQRRSKKKLRIKNWLLLLARMALVALMALALARPRLFSQTSLGDQEVPTALGLVFDTSLSMGYKPRDKTLLAEAKERAHEILKKLPDSSQVFVIDSAEPGVPPSMSPAAARKRVDALALRAANRPLNNAVGQAYRAVSESDRPRHEVYVLTDLARSSWDRERPVEGLDRLKKIKDGVGTYIVRLAPKDVRDVSIIDASPAVAAATPGEPVEIRSRVVSKGPATKRVAELYLDGVLRQKEAIALPANGEATVKFLTPKLDAAVPLHQGTVRITGGTDPLDFDDARYFTFKVQPALRVLVVADQAIDAWFVTQALDPEADETAAGTPRPFRVESIRTPEFAAMRRDALRDYATVFLLNVGRLGDADWGRLNAYVQDGGGLVVGLGDRCLPESYNMPGASQLLPASLKEKSPRDAKSETTFGKATDLTHALFQRYARELDELLAHVPIYRHWVISAPKTSRTLLAYADGSPALLERAFKGVRTGRVLLWTTPLARRADDRLESAWNEFPSPTAGGWSFWYLMNRTVPYMAGVSSEVLNFEAGQDVILPIDPNRRSKNYNVQNADAKGTDEEKSAQRLSPPATSDSLVVVSPQVGQWTVTGDSGEAAGAAGTMGFSVNAPVSEMSYVPLEARDLDALFGKGKYLLAEDAQSLRTKVQTVRVGVEMFPWLMALILILVTLENLLANKFYRESAPRPAVGAAA